MLPQYMKFPSSDTERSYGITPGNAAMPSSQSAATGFAIVAINTTVKCRRQSHTLWKMSECSDLCTVLLHTIPVHAGRAYQREHLFAKADWIGKKRHALSVWIG